MKRILIFAVILQAGLAVAQGSLAGVNGDCTVGGQQVLTQGLPSTGTQQIGTSNVLPGAGVMASFPMCSVSVVLSGTANNASIFSDNLASPTPLSNPFVANVDGTFVFFTAQGTCYDITTSSGSGPMLPYSRTYSDVCLGTGTGGGGGGGGVGNGSAGQLAIYLVSGSTVAGDTNLTDLLNSLIYTGSGGITAPILATNGAGGGLVQVGSDGVHAGTVQLSGNTTVPALTANTASDIGPNSASFTAYAWQRPTAENGSAGLLHVAAASSHISQESVSGVSIADHTASGTPGATTFLRGDNTWAVPAGGGGGCGSGTSGNLMEFTGTSTCGNAPIVDGGTTGLAVTTPTTGTWNVSTGGTTGGQSIVTGATTGVNYMGSIPLSQIGGSGAFSYCEWQSGGSGNFICKTLNSSGTSPALQLTGTNAVSAATWAIEDSSSKNGICGIATGGITASTCVGGGPTATGIEFRGDTGQTFTFRIAGSSTKYTAVSNSGVQVQAGQQFQSTAGAFSTLATCNGANEGAMAAVTDSSTNTWGATITGSSTNHVLAYCNGTNWTVMAK